MSDFICCCVIQVFIFVVAISLPIKRFFYLPDPLDYFSVILMGMFTMYGAFLSTGPTDIKIFYVDPLEEVEVKFIKYRKYNTRRLISFAFYNFVNACVYYFLAEYVFMIVFFVTFLFIWA